MPTGHFEGTIGDDWRRSSPWWPPVTRPPEGAPNVLLVVLATVTLSEHVPVDPLAELERILAEQ